MLTVDAHPFCHGVLEQFTAASWVRPPMTTAPNSRRSDDRGTTMTNRIRLDAPLGFVG